MTRRQEGLFIVIALLVVFYFGWVAGDEYGHAAAVIECRAQPEACR